MKYHFKKITCNLCGSNNYKIKGERGGITHRRPDFAGAVVSTIVKCRNCGLVYPNPMPYADANSIQEHYNSVSEYFNSHNESEKREASLQVIKEFEFYLPSRGKFLDVGSGLGTLCWAAKTSGWEPIGIDISPTFVKYSRQKYQVEILQGTLESMHFPSNSFDAVSLAGVLEHVYDPRGLLTEVSRVLKPGGIVFIDVPEDLIRL